MFLSPHSKKYCYTRNFYDSSSWRETTKLQMLTYFQMTSVSGDTNTAAIKPMAHKSLLYAEAYLEPCQTSKMEHFVKIVNGF